MEKIYVLTSHYANMKSGIVSQAKTRPGMRCEAGEFDTRRPNAGQNLIFLFRDAPTGYMRTQIRTGKRHELPCTQPLRSIPCFLGF